MTQQRMAASILGINLPARVAALVSPAILAVLLAFALAAQAQTFTVLHSFRGQDGREPVAGLATDRAGNLYGTTIYGGQGNNGTVFRLTRRGSGWIFAPLYSFSGGNDGGEPDARVTIGPDGSLYGTTFAGGNRTCGYHSPCGVVFRLRPPATFCASVSCPWTEAVLYSFNPVSGGYNPSAEVTFDQAGNLYSTTYYGSLGSGCFGGDCGVVFELSPSQGGWTETVLHQFTISDGQLPYAGVVFDQAGNLYGTTEYGGGGIGTVFELSPSGDGWTHQILHTFHGSDGASPIGTLIFDTAGDLYGTTSGPGTVFQLTPSDGSWSFATTFDLPGNGEGPESGLVMDASGNLYGATTGGGAYNEGTIFKLSPSGAGWTYTSLHDFTGGPDGSLPYGPLVLDASGNIYGTASRGGDLNDCSSDGCGTVWEITP
jgi:uncharacterized repeat protein (TIGR03803 family)